MDIIRLFIVDDEPMSIQYFKSFFTNHERYLVVGEACDGKRAYEKIKVLKPDLIFADISMPVMDGLTLAEKLLSEDEMTKIILLTSYRDFDYAKRGLRMGVTSYLLKHEINQEHLYEEIEKIMEKVRTQKETTKQLFHHNLKNFFLSSLDTAKKVPFCPYRKEDAFYLMEIIKRVPLVSFSPEPEVPDSIHLEDLENYKKERLWCRAVLELSPSHWLILCFTKSGCSRSLLRRLNHEFALTVQGLFQNRSDDVSILISDITGNFYELPYLHKQLTAHEDNLDLSGRRKIVYADELKPMIPKPSASNVTFGLLNELKKGENAALLNTRAILQEALHTGSIIEFRAIIKDMIKILEHFIEREQINFPIADHYKEIFSPEETSVWLEEVIHSLFAAVEANKNSGYSPAVRTALHFMERHYADSLSALEIAKACHLSESYLRKCFKQETGSNIIDCLTAIRIKKAKELLENENYKVTEIHQKVGFASSQYFSNVFKKIEGLCPSDYKKR